jgi:hypothetical protein
MKQTCIFSSLGIIPHLGESIFLRIGSIFLGTGTKGGEYTFARALEEGGFHYLN